MAQAGVIRDFMVALGFKTDNSGLNQMQGAMNGLELKATALKGALLALATGAVVAVRQTAGELDKLYYSSQRIGASVTNINAYGNAISQLGGSAEGAIGSLESLAEKMRNSPGYESQIKSLGVDTRNANGEMRDRVEMMKGLSGVLSKMPAYQANAYASSLGIDQNTLLAMRDGKFMSNMEKYQKIQKELGMNDDLAKSGNEFMAEYNDLTMMTKTGFQVIVMQAGKALIPILRLLNQLIQAGIQAFSQLNPEIKQGLAVGLRFAMLAVVFGGFIKVFGLLFKFIPAIKSLIGLVKLLNLAFLASPIGIVLALAAAIGLLWDDYSTWKDGGKSFIDWSKWTQEIDWVVEKIQELIQWIQNLTKAALDWSFGDGTYDSVVDFTSRKIIEPIANGIKKLTGGDTTKKAVEATVGTAKAVNDGIKGVAKQSQGSSVSGMKGNTLHLSKQDIEDLVKVTSTEVVGSLKGDAFTKQTQGVVDTVLNRVASGKWGDSVRDVANARRQFSKITGPKSYKTKDGKKIQLNPYGKVQNMPDKDVNPRVKAEVLAYLEERAKGKSSIVGGHLNYANPYSSDKKNRKEWVDAFYTESKKEGLVFGSGQAVHGHGTTKDLIKHKPKPFSISIRDGATISNSNTLSKSDVPNIQSYAPPSGNPYKGQVNTSSMSASNLTIHQSFKTDMTLNGVSSPMESANIMKRQQENDLAIMARGAKGVFTT